MMSTRNHLTIIDQSRVSSFHMILFIWLFLIIMFDGYDVVVYGSIVPLLIEEWGISKVTTGAIGSFTVIGTAIGGFFFGYLSDKIGRKNIIIFTVILFSLFSLLAGFATNPIVFAILRFIAGLGLGGVMPNVIAIATEYLPKKVRTSFVAMIFCGYSVGAMMAALTSRALLPIVSWQPVLWIGGLPLLFIPFLLKDLPESIDFLLKKGKQSEARKVLKRINPTFEGNIEFSSTLPEKGEKSPLIQLFQNKRGLSTVMFWLSCFSAFLLIYAMNTWLPTLLMEVGYDLSSSLVFTAVMQIGAIVGTVLFSPLVDKYGFKRILIPLYIGGAVSLSLIGFTSNIVVAYIFISLIGAASVGVQNIFNAVVSQYYPAKMRSTALGSTMAFGRIGGIVAPTFVGVLLTLGLQPQYNFMAISTAAVIGGIAISLVQVKYAYNPKSIDDQKPVNM